MNLQEIETLIRKYEAGETSLAEEKLLRGFLTGDGVPAHLKSFRDMFFFFDKESGKSLPGESFDEKILNEIEKGKVVLLRQQRNRLFYPVAGIAATVIILIGLFFHFEGSRQPRIIDTYSNPQAAYAEARKALLIVSANLNEGVGKVANVAEFNDGLKNLNNISTFETGVESLEKITIMENSTKTITLKQ